MVTGIHICKFILLCHYACAVFSCFLLCPNGPFTRKSQENHSTDKGMYGIQKCTPPL
jgi:hypothetical protein